LSGDAAESDAIPAAAWRWAGALTDALVLAQVKKAPFSSFILRKSVIGQEFFLPLSAPYTNLDLRENHGEQPPSAIFSRLGRLFYNILIYL
jgi:hypothetical protein